MVRRCTILAIILATLLIPVLAYGADIEYDAATDSLILHNPAAKRLLETIRDNEERAAVVESLKQEIQLREQEAKAKDSQLQAKDQQIVASEKAIAKADFIMGNFGAIEQSYKAILESQQKSFEYREKRYQEMLASCTEEVKSSRKDVFWARVSSIASIILAVFSFGFAH